MKIHIPSFLDEDDTDLLALMARLHSVVRRKGIGVTTGSTSNGIVAMAMPFLVGEYPKSLADIHGISKSSVRRHLDR